MKSSSKSFRISSDGIRTLVTSCSPSGVPIVVISLYLASYVVIATGGLLWPKRETDDLKWRLNVPRFRSDR